MHFFRYRHGHLHCEDVDLARVAQQFGTPLYVYSAGTILDHYRRLDAALASRDHLICYAVKANSNRAILRLLAEAGAGFDIVSGGELFRVLAAGGDPRKCTFAGVGKSREEIAYALRQGVYSFNVESEAELNYIDQIAAGQGARAPIALRVNPDIDPHTHEYISTGSHENKFGIALDHVGAIYERAAKMDNVDIVGVQMHIGSQITEAEPFAEAMKRVAPLARELKSKYGIKFFSIGGGLGIVYESSFESGTSDWWKERTQPTPQSSQRSTRSRSRGGRKAPGEGESSSRSTSENTLSIQQYVDAILPPLRELGLRILLEPGRLLVGNAGVLMTQVRYLKSASGRIRRGERTRHGTSPSNWLTGQKKFAIVDAGMNDLIRPALYHSYHEIVPVTEPGGTDSVPSAKKKDDTEVVPPSAPSREKIDIVGPVCESGDFFALDREMPDVGEGDLLAIMSAGAYGFVMASNYNSRPLPAEVLVRGDKFALIRKRQTWEDLVRDEVEL
jgi:diaminopimelate decarboxylase